MKFDESNIRSEIEKIESELNEIPEEKSNDRFNLRWKVEYLNRKLRLKYRCSEVEAIYVLNKINSGVAKEFLLVAIVFSEFFESF